jgi:hypothetical protein
VTGDSGDSESGDSESGNLNRQKTVKTVSGVNSHLKLTLEIRAENRNPNAFSSPSTSKSS